MNEYTINCRYKSWGLDNFVRVLDGLQKEGLYSRGLISGTKKKTPGFEMSYSIVDGNIFFIYWF